MDSLKDAALKLSDDETGCWVEPGPPDRHRRPAPSWSELHHPRKGQEGNRKPSKLDDLYGSRWIPAGAGSVISLWGQAGDPIVELSHLKPVVATVGPWLVSIGADGTVSIQHGIDLVEQVMLRGTQGLTAQVAAQLLNGGSAPTRAQVEKARRRLDKKVIEGVLVRRDGRKGGDHGGDHAAYFRAAITKAITGAITPRSGDHAHAGRGAITKCGGHSSPTA